MAQRILVTGGNSGIGLALCLQLATEHGCHVYLGSRSVERGTAAVDSIKKENPSALVELVQVDVSSDESVKAAAATVQAKLGGEKLYALVNNAGTGLAHGTDAQTQLQTNLYGPKRMVEAFLPLISSTEGRIVNVGSGAGPIFVGNEKCPLEVKKMLCSPDVTWEQIDTLCKGDGLSYDTMGGYGLSKACLTAYTMWLAKQHPGLTHACLTPGFIDTAIVKGWNATKKPAEGTVSLRHCLFQKLGGNGWFFGSDGKRSPLNFMRNPGEPEYDGKPPYQ